MNYFEKRLYYAKNYTLNKLFLDLLIEIVNATNQ